MMPLTMCKAGEENEIKKIGGKEETRRHLENLGFVVGGKVAVISETDGNMIVNVKEARVAIGKDTVKATKLTGEGPVKRRIMDMGITKGVEIYVRKVAPLGDPVEVTVRGYELSLRKADAEMIQVE